MLVLFCLTKLGAGGTERSTALLATELRRIGIDAQIVVLERSTIGYEAEVEAAGVPLHITSGSSRLAKLVDLRRTIKRISPDIFHTAIFDADVLGRIAAWRSGAVVISSLINTSYEPVRLSDARVRRIKLTAARLIDGWTARHLTAALHAVSDGVADANAAHLGIDRSKIRVVERGRDPVEFRPPSEVERRVARDNLDIGKNASVLLAVGRIDFQKGHVHAIDAVAQLRKDRSDLETVLLIAGRPGNASEAVDRAIASNNLGSGVRILGHRTDVAELLWASDVFVLPSIYEGTAGAALEAMAAGVAIVASELPGLEGVLENGKNAFLVTAGDSEGLVKGVTELTTNEDLHRVIVERARRDFVDCFTLERSAERLAALYRSLLAAPEEASA